MTQSNEIKNENNTITPKYKLGAAKEFNGKTLFRIIALRSFSNVIAGDIGGWIESEANLSHDGNAWVFDEAMVYGNAKVFGNAELWGNAEVFGNARVYNYARIADNAMVWDNTMVYDYALVLDDAKVYENSHVFGNGVVRGDTSIFGDAIVTKAAVSLPTDEHMIVITDNHISIGGKNFPIENWNETDKEIAKINFGADNWWKKWKPIAFGIIEAYPNGAFVKRG